MELDKSMFEIKLEINKNMLTSTIQIEKNIHKDIEYAFYLLLNNQKKEIKYFSKSNVAEFFLFCDGEYSVAGFIKINNKKIMKTSEIIKVKYDKNNTLQLKKTSINIFGSCVSRDLFNFDLENKFQVKTYIARQSIVSAVSNPLECDIKNIDLKSKFQKIAVYDDFRKNAFQKLKNEKSDYIIIDLIDERFKLLEYKEKGVKSILTYSVCLQESHYVNELKFLERKRRRWGGKNYSINGKSLKKYIVAFMDKILEIYNPENIILHRVKMSNYYIDKNKFIQKFNRNHLNNNKNVNELLDYMYDCIEEYVKNINVINISSDYCADENNKWGLAPMHYQKEYYQEVLKELMRLNS